MRIRRCPATVKSDCLFENIRMSQVASGSCLRLLTLEGRAVREPSGAFGAFIPPNLEDDSNEKLCKPYVHV